MIRRIQALNFRCLRYVDLKLDRFRALIGPNASGKSTLFDAVVFLGDLVREGLEGAVGRRTPDFRDLVWDRPDGEIGFELAIEADVPGDLIPRLPPDKDFRVFRYEIAIRDGAEGLRISSERALLMPMPKDAGPPVQRSLFPAAPRPPATILLGRGRTGMRSVLSKSPRGGDGYYVETASKAGHGWVSTIELGSLRSTLANVPESPLKFPVSTFFKRMLETRVRRVALDSEAMRRPCPPRFEIDGMAADGSNLPWLVKRLRDDRGEDHREWLRHVRTVLSDLRDVRVVVRPEDGRAYLMLEYDAGTEAPSWTASDGTVRFLALTLLAYLPDNGHVHLLEEPENGIHPLALNGVVDSLQSVYDAQVLAATYSLAFVEMLEPSAVLCFGKDSDGATDVVPGDEHPIVEAWRGPLDKSALFAYGVVG